MTILILPLPMEAIRQYCQRWNIRAMALFCSVLRPNVRPGSNVDVLVTFHADAEWGLLAHLQMQQDLATVLDRPVEGFVK